MFRDPRYLAPLGVLLGVMLVSALLASDWSRGSSAAAPAPAVLVEPSSAPAVTDADRLQDLTELRAAMLAYRRQHGTFPVTPGGITTICAAQTDRGCVLGSLADAPPFADRDQPYWFVSDGVRVVLVAAAEAASNSAQCPRVLPNHLAAAPLICLQIGRAPQ